MESYPKTKVENKNRPSSAHPSRLPRTNILYWRSRIERTVSQNGKVNVTYSVRIEWKAKRVRFALNTANKNKAANEALKIFNFLTEEGWDETIAKFKSGSAAQNGADENAESKPYTVGEFIEIASRHSTARPQSVEEYAKALRRVVSGVMGFEGDDYVKHDHGDRTPWREAVETTPLSKLTPAKIQAWRNNYIKDAGHSEMKRRKATTTTNSLIRNAKALFSRKILPFVAAEIELPSPLPFEGVFLSKQPSNRYQSKVDGREILKAAESELKDSQPEVYKMLLLALVCGLRVSEIDYLLWKAFDFKARLLRVENTDYHRLKSEDSEGEIDLSDTVADYFKMNEASASGEFVIESPRSPDKKATSRSYRCEPHIAALKDWLRAQGVTAQKPIHELRKEIGSIIANDHGIFAASRYLRHADIRITSSIYADKKKRVVAALM